LRSQLDVLGSQSLAVTVVLVLAHC
jgi:hypothetical protein